MYDVEGFWWRATRWWMNAGSSFESIVHASQGQDGHSVGEDDPQEVYRCYLYNVLGIDPQTNRKRRKEARAPFE